jgi:hypothetical protein
VLPPSLADAFLTQPPAHVATCKQSAPQSTIVWGAAPGIFWIKTDDDACKAQSTRTTSDDPQSSNAGAQQTQLVPFNLTTL